MSAGDEDVRREEIIIVRRGGGDGEHGHHGGAWKIAYADFMTAMMALFLVMWLVNAASKDTRAQVASYFNPIKLSDSIAGPRGLSEMQPGSRSKNTAKPKPEEEEKKKKKSEKATEEATSKFSTREFFNDPHGVLAKLARANAAKEKFKKSEKKKEKAGAAFRDPFDPAFRRQFQIPNPTDVQPKLKTREAAAKPKKLNPGAAKQGDAAKTVAEKDGGKETAKPTWAATVKRAGPKLPAQKQVKLAKADIKPNKDEAGKSKDKSQKEKQKAGVKAVAQDLAKKIQASLKKNGKFDHPLVNVKVTEGGVLLSLTDQVGYSMFDLSSAVPAPKTVALVDKLSAAIKKHHKGAIIISGHTDARAFASGKYDNWRLSTDRAHAFYHMLSRGGVDMSRIERVQGFAAQRPKVLSDLNSPVNRRVEITLRTN